MIGKPCLLAGLFLWARGMTAYMQGRYVRLRPVFHGQDNAKVIGIPQFDAVFLPIGIF